MQQHHAAEQLLLDLGHRAALGREDFLIAPSNAEAVSWIDLWPEWSAPALVLHGPAACGKTHLAAVWRDISRARWLNAADLPACGAGTVAGSPEMLVIDHLDPWVGDAGVEETLFHIYNIIREEKRAMLLTMRTAPVRQPFVLRDLASRLRAAPAVAIQPPDDTLLAAVIAKMFSDRQIRINADVLDYVVPRMERSFAAARRLVERADGVAMRDKRPLSVPLMRKVMAELASQEPADLAAGSTGSEDGG